MSSSISVDPGQEILVAGTGGYKPGNFGTPNGDFAGYHRKAANAVDGSRSHRIVPGARMDNPRGEGKVPLTLKEAQERARAVHIPHGHPNLDHLLEADGKLSEANQVKYGWVGTRNDQHFKDINRFVEAGKGVVSEKPMTITDEDADTVLRKVTDKQLPFVTAYTYTNYPTAMQARELVLNGDIGEIEGFDAKYIQGWLETTENDQGIWRTDPKVAGAGATGDILTHIYELMRFTTGSDIKNLKAKTNAIQGRNIDDNVWVEATLENGAPVTLHASQTTEHALNDISYTIKGSKGTITWTMNNDEDKPNELKVEWADGREPTIYKVSNGDEAFSQRVRDQIPGPGRHHFGNRDAIERMHQVVSNEMRAKPNYHYSGVHSGVAGTKFVNKVLESATLNSGEFGDTVEVTPVGNPDLSTY